MLQIETVQATEAYRKKCEDRVAVLKDGDRTIVVVADGAGGAGNGDVAAETVVREVRAGFAKLMMADDFAGELGRIDGRIPAGESTAVIVEVTPGWIVGASVGDSQAWIIRDGRLRDLTAGQNRKPLLGSRAATPVSFSYGWQDEGVLIVATDGFCNYVKREELTATVAQTEFHSLARRCIEMVRLPSGDLWDDVGVVVARVRRPRRRRGRYEILQ